MNAGPYTLNGITYTSSGLYIQNFISANGCDSLVYIYLTIAPLRNQTIQMLTNYTKPGISPVHILIYPNPTSNSATIKSNLYLDNATIRLYDPSGRIFIEKSNQNGFEFNIDLSLYAVGLYHVEIENHGIKYYTKVRKE
ncbi:MAG: T9SS type A sorting domain-containing protein [Chitinophagaceae bacterium]